MITPDMSLIVDIQPSLKWVQSSQEQMTNPFTGRLSFKYELEGYDLLGSSCIDLAVSVNLGGQARLLSALI